jgi:hypothetical protein
MAQRRFQNDPDDIKVKTINKHEIKKDQSRNKGDTAAQRAQKARGQTGITVQDLKPINKILPYRRSFLGLIPSASETAAAQNRGFLKKVKGMFDGGKGKGLSKEEIVKLRKSVGDLKDISDAAEGNDAGKDSQGEDSNRPQTKKEMLEAKRKALADKSKTAKKSSPGVGMRIEIEKQKKNYPHDPNLAILSAILTSKDSASTHRSHNERISSLYSALEATAAIVMNDYMTTYSVDMLCDIYFLYLEAIKPKLQDNLKSVKVSESHSIRRDIHVLNMLLEQKRLKKSISNIAKKLDGFGYPYETMSPFHIAKTFQASNEESDNRIGPGTAKLNKFLIRIYLNVFGQIPVFMPIAKRICDVLPSNRHCRALIANVNIENAVMKMQIAKLNKSAELPKMITTVYNYGKSFIGVNFADTVTSPLEAKILIKITQMVVEMALLSPRLDPQVVKYAYNCATIALHYYKDDAEVMIRRISDIAARQRLELN